MLFPGDGIEGIKRFYLDSLIAFGRRGLACQPAIIGIGLGGSKDSCMVMGKRAAGHKFMPNKFVFTGGKVDVVDSRIRPPNDLHPSVLKRLMKGCSVSRARSLALAAIRETFEETGLILGEAVMLALGDRIGRLDAHHVVEHASKEAVRTGATLFDVLAADATVSAHLSRDALARLLDPAHYVGEAQAYVDAVLALHAGTIQPGEH
jgi:8-oxo-dGTP pyrophosphatase MutT (NUDIX family)